MYSVNQKIYRMYLICTEEFYRILFFSPFGIKPLSLSVDFFIEKSRNLTYYKSTTTKYVYIYSGCYILSNF